MARSPKTSQLQIRVSNSQKELIQKLAAQAGMDMSTFVLNKVLPSVATRFQEYAQGAAGPESGLALAELNSFLAGLSATELEEAVAHTPRAPLTPYLLNYLTAMVEYTCQKKRVKLPAWTRAIPPLQEPVFGTTLKSLRSHLLANSPPPFRFRNIFIDSTVGDRV